MVKELNLALLPEVAFETKALNEYLLQYLGVKENELHFEIKRRSIDARSKQVKVNLHLIAYMNEEVPKNNSIYAKVEKNVSAQKQAIIVGAGPAGLFAALELIEQGIKPIIIERGKNVRERRRDLAALNKTHLVNPNSNYCFGEGGAGTYSDGKLYTRSDKRGNIRHILEILVAHGASEAILVDAHPHIGTNKLPQLIEEIRTTILNCGGQIHFNSKVIDFILEKNEIRGVITQHNEIFEGIGVILATGHSARDIFYLLAKKNIDLAAKPFAMGVRIEHPQSLIDKMQYHCEIRDAYLPPSSYSLVTQVAQNGTEKGVFSFCMCPGGIIAPCATENGEVVVNGWSPSKRNNPFANAGIVTTIDSKDWKEFESLGALAGLKLQELFEKRACILSGGNQTAPAQKMVDFIEKKHSTTLNTSSYQPGIASIEMDAIFSKDITYRLRNGLKIFGQKMKGYLTNEAQVVGVESRTSSPVRIPRDKQTCEHISTKRLFPSGEGAGYAGGIVSAAMDGRRCASELARLYSKTNN
jgi:uncharacterized protein